MVSVGASAPGHGQGHGPPRRAWNPVSLVGLLETKLLVFEPSLGKPQGSGRQRAGQGGGGQCRFIVQTSPDLVTRLVTGDGWPPTLTFHPSLLNRPNYCICLSFEPQMIHSGHGGRLHFPAPVWRAPLIVSFRGSLSGGFFGPHVSGEETCPATVEGMSLSHEHQPSEGLGFWLSAAEGSWLILLGSLGFNSGSALVKDFPFCSLVNCAVYPMATVLSADCEPLFLLCTQRLHFPVTRV